MYALEISRTRMVFLVYKPMIILYIIWWVPNMGSTKPWVSILERSNFGCFGGGPDSGNPLIVTIGISTINPVVIGVEITNLANVVG